MNPLVGHQKCQSIHIIFAVSVYAPCDKFLDLNQTNSDQCDVYSSIHENPAAFTGEQLLKRICDHSIPAHALFRKIVNGGQNHLH